jgi:hypothetical protein
MSPVLRLLAVVSLIVFPAVQVGAQPTCVSDYQCADGNLCNGIEHCIAGTCAPSTAPLVCDDGDPCTVDSCNPAAGCAHADTACAATCGPSDDGLRCSDGTACTAGDTCSGGACVGTPLACDDGDPCTADTCDAQLGCTYTERTDPPVCLSSAQCVSAADHTPCVADGDPCTQDGCLEGACRVGLNQILRQCSDGDACNGEEFCSAVKGCEPGPPLVCDDGDACDGVESCVPATGCVAGTPLPDGSACDDDQSCTEADACAAGACVGTPLACDDGDVGTADFCLESAGCLNCVSFAKPHLDLRFATATKGGTFTASGSFLPTTSVAPTATGADFVLHDGATILQQAHVDGPAFRLNASGKMATFVDRAGTLAQGLTRMRLNAGPAGTRHQTDARGALDPDLPHDIVRRMTVRAGTTCATTILTCTPKSGGRRDRCR